MGGAIVDFIQIGFTHLLEIPSGNANNTRVLPGQFTLQLFDV